MPLCHICHEEVEEERKLCRSRECNLIWQGMSLRERRSIVQGNITSWQSHLKYKQRYRAPATITLPKLKFMEGEP